MSNGVSPNGSAGGRPARGDGGEEIGGNEDAAREDGGLVVRDPISAPDAEGTPRRVTRRFPLFTKDTARPEGGGRAASGAAPAPARQWPMLAVLALVGLGLLVTALDLFRIGTLLIGVALLCAAALRWLLPGVGMLAVRSRFTDIVTYGGLGLVIVLLALMVQPKPWLEIPFLKDTLHFTVSSS
ncbi:membrane protein [Streptomyces sp. AS58]|nr:membrane protein [Streptomyces sp. AS58]